MNTGLLLVAAAVVVLCFLNWRLGILLCLCVGFLQDPVRKLLPERPVFMVVAVAACFAACLAGVYARGEQLSPRRLFRWHPSLAAPTFVFTGIVLVQSGYTLVATGSPVLTGIGLLAYLSPLLALLLVEHYAVDYPHLERWLKWYLAGALGAASTVLLQWAGWNPVVFASVTHEWISGRSGMVRTLSGIMRTSEIAAWHAAAGACLLFAWVIGARTLRGRWLGGVAVAGLLLAVFLTGRRKMLAEVALFLLFYGYFVLRHRRGGARLVQVAAVALIAVFFGLQLRSAPQEGTDFEAYLERGSTVFVEAGGRLSGMTIGVFGRIVERNGFFGSGAGTGGQGSQYFGGGRQLVGGIAEGGAGRVLAELGVPGLLALLWLALALGQAILRIVRFARTCPVHQAFRIYGLAAFLPANAAVFLTAHEVYGDPFVLIVLGLVGGSLLAYPTIVLRDRYSFALHAARRRPVPVAAPARSPA